MLKRGLVLELRREHLLLDGFAAMLRHARAIVVVVVVVILALPIEITRAFMFVGSSILQKSQRAAWSLVEQPGHIQIGIWSGSRQYHYSNTRTASCYCQI